ncbi:Alpha/beta hydrolase family protein [compost metagenome]
MQATHDGLRLRFDPATEISIYRSLPHTRPAPAQRLELPLAMVRGSTSGVVKRHHARAVLSLPRGEYHSLPGGHMFPLERPTDTASLIKGLFDRWQQGPA